MKSISAYLLSVLFLMAVHYQSINYFLNIVTVSGIDLIQDLDYEEENSTSEEKNEKDEKTDYCNYLFFEKTHPLTILPNQFSLKHSQAAFHKTEYCQTIFSPPELA